MTCTLYIDLCVYMYMYIKCSLFTMNKHDVWYIHPAPQNHFFRAISEVNTGMRQYTTHCMTLCLIVS